jgi:DinB superfamily
MSVDHQERQLILDQLASSEKGLLDLVAGLTPQQWTFRETPDRWSIADNIEHVIVFEKFLRNVISKTLSEAPQPDKKPLAPAKEHHVFEIATNRTARFTAREATRPTGRFPNPTEMVTEFRKTHAETITFVNNLDGDLRSHFFAHVALADLDCYQWLVVLAQHGSRHALQIEQIKADPAYPTV